MNVCLTIIYLDDLKELLKDVKEVLSNPERAKEIMPMPKKVRAEYDVLVKKQFGII